MVAVTSSPPPYAFFTNSSCILRRGASYVLTITGRSLFTPSRVRTRSVYSPPTILAGSGKSACAMPRCSLILRFRVTAPLGLTSSTNMPVALVSAASARAVRSHTFSQIVSPGLYRGLSVWICTRRPTWPWK